MRVVVSSCEVLTEVTGMTDSHTWTLIIALIVILLGSEGLVLYVVHATMARRAETMRKVFEDWQAGAISRAQTGELQRAALETRLAAIETRLTVALPGPSLLEEHEVRRPTAPVTVEIVNVAQHVVEPRDEV